jgi:3-hydroxyacyl-CoA dehydrogenase
MTSLVTLTRHARVGVLTLNNPPVNALSHALRVALLEQLRAAAADSELDAVVIACAGRTFVAGADIREFGKPPLAPDLPELVEFLDQIDKPLVAAIHGTALGGGLELTLACHYRLAAGGARVGLPEVTLGILPGAGGTQRLPRLVGARAALDLIVGGAIIPATTARTLGIIDEVVSDDVTAGAIAFAESVVAERRPLRRTSALAVPVDDPGVFEEYEQLAARKWRGFLAPSRCIAAVRAAVELPFAEGLRRERELFAELMASAESRAQRHVFFAEREVARVPGLPEETPVRPVARVGLVGSGMLVEQIAACFAGARLPVAVLDPEPGGSERCVAQIRDRFAEAVAQGSLKQKEMDERLAVIRPALGYRELADADLLLEAVSEDMASKRVVFEQLDAVGKPGAVLAATSSWSSLDELASATTRPADVIGMHFSAPLDSTRLLENARGPLSSAEACATAMKVGRSLGRVSVLVAARPGLVLDRLQARGAVEGTRLLEEGASAAQIERVLYDFGIPKGWHSALAHEPLGKSRGLGSPGQNDARRQISDQEVLERYLFSMVNEAARVLEEKVVTRALEIDMICVHGSGFPSYRGGPLFYADELGLAAVHQAILKYAADVDAPTWTPPELLTERARAGGRFYDAVASR